MMSTTDEKSWMQVADDLINNHRNNQYAHPLPNFIRIALYWSIDTETIITPVQVARMMMVFKVARDIHGFTPDNYIDSIGYAGCVQRMDHLMKAMGYKEGVARLYNVDMNFMFFLLAQSLRFLEDTTPHSQSE